MNTITRRGITQTKQEFLIQELNGLAFKLSLLLDTTTDPVERKETKDRIEMLESIISDCYQNA